MNKARAVLLSLSVVLLCSLFSAAQQSATAANATNAVPPLIPFSSVATDAGGSSLSGVVSITFSLYAGQQGGAALWTETQNNVPLDPTGHYSVQLGITEPNGVPTTLFTTTEARWLGVRIAEQVEQPRVLLLSVPYALKAGDAATIGGLPPSAFVLAAPSSGSSPTAPMDASAASQTLAPPTGTAVTGTGTKNFLPLWDSTSDIISSVLFQSAAAPFKIGINTTTPATTLDVKGAGTIRGILSLPATGAATATKGANSQPLNLVASVFNSTSSTAVNQTFQWQAEPAPGTNDTANPSGTLNLLFGAGTTKPAETGLNIASTGVITFNAAQTFPNTITGVTTATGSGLIGGATSGTPSLSLLNNCTINQVLQWNGTAWACATVGGGSGSGTVTSVATGLGLFGGPIITSGTLTIDTTVVPQLGVANTFTGNQTVVGNVIATTGYEIQYAGTNRLFDYGTPFTGGGFGNSFLGFAGNSTMTGTGNVGAGWVALGANTTGTNNTAVGVNALAANSSGQQNTAVGVNALFANGAGSSSTGNANTAVGYQAAANNLTGFNNTAIGATALANNNGGVGNTAIGSGALFNNTGSSSTGDYNTAVGYEAGPTTGSTLTNSTAIGFAATVSESNALVLGSTGAYAVKVGIGTAAPAYTLDAAGTIRSSSGGFMFPDGTTQTTAASGGGGGTVTSITAGTGLTGGTITTSGTLSINPAVIPELGAANTFTANQTVSGNLSATGVVTGSSYQIGSRLFAYGSIAKGNAFLGFAGSTTSASAGGDVAVGFGALPSDTGGSNTALGYAGLLNNTTGAYNTGLGNNAGGPWDGSNLTGSNNTAVGAFTQFSTGSLSNATAIGANAEVSESNALVLGSFAASPVCQAFGCANTNVGIGTVAPTHALEVNSAGASSAQMAMITNGTDAAFSLNNTATGGREYWIDSGSGSAGIGAGNFAVYDRTAGETRLAVNSVGNVGIGTTAPQYTLDVHGTANFTGNVTFAPTQIFSGSSGFINATTGFDIGGIPFAFGSAGNLNAFLGFSGNATETGILDFADGPGDLASLTTGGGNTAVGSATAQSISSGSDNTAVGSNALLLDTTGYQNTAVGETSALNTNGFNNTAIGMHALVNDLNGNGNTALGAFSGPDPASTGLFNATTVGGGATVSASNALVLGVTTAGNPGAAFVNVGIGTATPRSILEAVVSTAEGLGPTITLTNSAGGGSTSTSLDFNSYAPATSGTYNPAARILVTDAGSFSDNILFQSNIPGAADNGLQTNMEVYSKGGAAVWGSTAALNSSESGGVGISATGGNVDSGTGNGGEGGSFAGGEGAVGGSGVTVTGGLGGDGGGDGIDAAGGAGILGSNGYAGYFVGNVEITGTLNGNPPQAKIDDPLDPSNKYLFHSSVESSEMKNMYDGTITTDGEGLAVVQLPDWFEALNTDFRYQLTVIGQFAQAIVSSKVAGHQFGIRTDKPNVEVSWQITGVRQDAYAKAHPLVVEQAKDALERGHYIHPELYGAPEQQSIEWARHPEMMKGMQEMRARQLAAAQGQTTTTRAETLPLAVPPTPKAMPQRPTPRVAPVRPAGGSVPPVRAELQPLAAQPR